MVTGASTTPRSFTIETHQGATLRRHLRLIPASAGETQMLVQKEQSYEQQPESILNTGTTLSQPSNTQTGLLMSRSGGISKPVDRLDL